MSRHDDDHPEAAPTDDDQAGQVSEGGGSLDADETAVGGADAVPDKTTGTEGANAAD